MDNKINELRKVSGCNKWIAWGVIAVALILSFATIKNGLDNSSKSCDLRIFVVSDSLSKPCNLRVLVVSDSLSNVKYLLSDTCKMSPANQKKDTSSVSDTTSSKSPAKASMTQKDISRKIYVIDTSVILLYCCILVFIAFSLWGAFTILFRALKFENDMKSKILDVQKEIYKEEQMWAVASKKKQQEFEDKKKELRQNKETWIELEKERTEMRNAHELALKDREIQLKKSAGGLKEDDSNAKDGTSTTKS